MAVSISSAIFKPEFLFYIIISITAFKLKSTGKQQTNIQTKTILATNCAQQSPVTHTKPRPKISSKYHLIAKIKNTSSGFLNTNEKLANMLFDICEHFKKNFIIP